MTGQSAPLNIDALEFGIMCNVQGYPSWQGYRDAIGARWSGSTIDPVDGWWVRLWEHGGDMEEFFWCVVDFRVGQEAVGAVHPAPTRLEAISQALQVAAAIQRQRGGKNVR